MLAASNQPIYNVDQVISSIQGVRIGKNFARRVMRQDMKMSYRMIKYQPTHLNSLRSKVLRSMYS